MAFGIQSPNERRALKYIAAVSVIAITIGLTLLNTTGAWYASGGNPWYTIVVGGAEIGVAVFFGLAVIATTPLRKWAGIAIFLALVWACIENGKMAITQSFDQVFIDSPESLRKKADLVEAQAPMLEAQALRGEGETRARAAALRSEIAALESERDLMASPGRVREAQQRLQALGLYRLPVDGIYGEETRQAMIARGEVLSMEIDRKGRELEGLDAVKTFSQESVDMTALGADAVTLSPAQVARATAVEMRKKADEIEYRTRWMYIILIAFEGARSFGVWAFLMSTTSGPSRLREEDIETGPAEVASAAPKPVFDPRDDWTPDQWRGEKGSAAREHYDLARRNAKLPIPPSLRVDERQKEVAE